MEQKEIEFLRKELIGIHSEWELVLHIFGEDGNHKLINEEIHKSVKAVFLSFHNALMASIVHRISRLLDPKITGRKPGKNKNLSLVRLHNQPELKKDLKKLYSLIEKDWEKIKPLRDKVLAHNDMHTSVSGADDFTWKNQYIDSIIKNINSYFESALGEDILGSVVSINEGGERFMKLFSLGVDSNKKEIKKRIELLESRNP